MPDTNVPAELSPCNGNSAILGQHEACPDRDDNERTRPVTTPSVRPSRATRELFSPLPTAAGLHDGSLTYINDEVVLFWQPPSGFSQWTLSPFTVDLVEYSCAKQFMMASKARLFGDDSMLSAIFATDDPREHKRFGRQVHQGAFEQMVATGAADESYVRSTPPRSWSGFGSHEPLNTNRQARLTAQFYHNNTPSASLAVWIYVVPNKTMRCSLLIDRDSWTRFHSRSYRTLAPASDGRVFGELTLSHTFDDAYTSATAYIRSCATTNVVHQLRYDDPGMSLTSSPQLVPVNLTRLNGYPALTGHHMVDITTSHDDQYPSEHFVASGRQTIPLTGNRDLEHGNILGTASAPLLRVPLEALVQHNELSDVTAVSEASATNAAPTASEQPSTELLHRLDHDQRESFFASGVRYRTT